MEMNGIGPPTYGNAYYDFLIVIIEIHQGNSTIKHFIRVCERYW